jgi:HD-GYP domain-containing protein (c-di-GMP phosphodiesterase class II)
LNLTRSGRISWINYGLHESDNSHSIGYSDVRDRDHRRIPIWNVCLVSDLVMRNFALAWLQGLRRYDLATYMHSLRAAKYFVDFASYVGVHESESRVLHLSSSLHDIGKMAVSSSILQKKGSLSHEEYCEMKKHSEVAFTWMTLFRDPNCLSDIPYLHHERWDGGGYPLGLKGIAIPRLVRLFSVVDVWDAMINDRPYHDAIPEEMVLRYFLQTSGILFDPEVVDAFLTWRCKFTPVSVATTLRVTVD